MLTKYAPSAPPLYGQLQSVPVAGPVVTAAAGVHQSVLVEYANKAQGPGRMLAGTAIAGGGTFGVCYAIGWILDHLAPRYSAVVADVFLMINTVGILAGAATHRTGGWLPISAAALGGCIGGYAMSIGTERLLHPTRAHA
jgi:hypothetical protein